MAAAALGLGVSRRVECCRCIIPPIQITTIRNAATTVRKKKKGKKEKTNKVFDGRCHFQPEPGRRKRNVAAHLAAG